MTIVGYARVSSIGQDLGVQVEKLEAANCERIYQEKKSGADQSRPQLREALDYVRNGDTFVITRIDRLARSVSHLSKVVDTLKDKGVHLVIVDQNIDTSNAAGKAMLQMLGIFAEFENEIRRERQMDGIARAKREDEASGVSRFGRPVKVDDEARTLIHSLKADNVSMANIELRTGLSRATIYRSLKKSA